MHTLGRNIHPRSELIVFTIFSFDLASLSFKKVLSKDLGIYHLENREQKDN